MSLSKKISWISGILCAAPKFSTLTCNGEAIRCRASCIPGFGIFAVRHKGLRDDSALVRRRVLSGRNWHLASGLPRMRYIN